MNRTVSYPWILGRVKGIFWLDSDSYCTPGIHGKTCPHMLQDTPWWHIPLYEKLHFWNRHFPFRCKASAYFVPDERRDSNSFCCEPFVRWPGQRIPLNESFWKRCHHTSSWVEICIFGEKRREGIHWHEKKPSISEFKLPTTCYHLWLPCYLCVICRSGVAVTIAMQPFDIVAVRLDTRLKPPGVTNLQIQQWCGSTGFSGSTFPIGWWTSLKMMGLAPQLDHFGCGMLVLVILIAQGFAKKCWAESVLLKISA